VPEAIVVDLPGSQKQAVRDMLDRLPEDVTLEQIVDQVALMTVLEQTLADVRNGKVVAPAERFEQMRRQLTQYRGNGPKRGASDEPVR
jgi:hypothetical protein